MMTSRKTVAKDYATDSFIEKKSEFIAYVKRIGSEDEAKAFIAEIRAKHPDARHNCYAYVLADTGAARCSDDGEPSGTAGLPILEVLNREGLVGVCVVVTRYFGGILLGAGGLTRAYARAAKIGIDAAGRAELVPFTYFQAAVSYAEYQKLVNEMPKYAVECTDTVFAAEVTLTMRARDGDFERFKAYVTEYTAGRVSCTVTERRQDAAPTV